jgi:hypothetical protein
MSLAAHIGEEIIIASHNEAKAPRKLLVKERVEMSQDWYDKFIPFFDGQHIAALKLGVQFRGCVSV